MEESLFSRRTLGKGPKINKISSLERVQRQKQSSTAEHRTVDSMFSQL